MPQETQNALETAIVILVGVYQDAFVGRLGLGVVAVAGHIRHGKGHRLL